jgi:RHS repeat-associated protein
VYKRQGVTYDGPKLTASTTYYWRIRFWDSYGAPGLWSTTTASFSVSTAIGSPIFTSLVQSLAYTYDSVGNILTIVDRSGTLTAATTTYSYDDLSRVTTASTTKASSTPYSQTYTYDAVGNIITKSDIGSYSYQGNTGSLYANPHAPTSIAGVPHSYDRNGNLATTTTITNTWSYNNLLTQYAKGTTTVSYRYDAEGARVRKAASSTTLYPSTEYELTGAVPTKHIYVGDTLIASVQGTSTTASTTYVHTDHLGSTAATTNDIGYVSSVTAYYPFGSTRIDTHYGSYREPNKYIGQDYDPETALAYLNARYYDGGRGQFLSQDPVFWEIGQTRDGITALLNPQAQNSYSYAGNNPITQKDPEGRYLQYVVQALIGVLTPNTCLLYTSPSPRD